MTRGGRNDTESEILPLALAAWAVFFQSYCGGHDLHGSGTSHSHSKRTGHME